MRQLLTRFLFAVPFVVALTLPVPAIGGETRAAVIAVLDLQKILRESNAAKTVAAQVETYKNGYQEQIRIEEEELRAEEQELKRQRPILAQEAFDQKRRAFERRVAEVQRRVRERSRALDRVVRQSRQKLSQEVLAIVSDMSAANGFNLVLERSQVVFFGKPLEITDEVMAQLNKRLPSIRVPPPEGQ